ncbi:MAG: SRPBCC family protein [Gemmatimonadetes bacterium]|nr:SRPBCC family protein [Gemmatimonadota bacterium]
MSIALNETFRVSAPPDLVWQFLKNPADVVTCLPGAELTETIDAQTYGGRVKVKVGPITAKYAGQATLVQVDDAARRMQIVAEGKETGGPGSARMTLNGLVTPLADGSSEVRVDATIDIAGRVMQFGRGLIESVNKQLFRQFADAVQARLQDAHAADVAAAGPSTARPSSQPPPSPPGHVRPEPGAVLVVKEPTELAGEELRALPLLWKVFLSWLSGLFGKGR